MFKSLIRFFGDISNQLKIAQKLVISYLFLGLATTITITLVFYKSSENALIDRTINQLSSIKLLKKKWLEQYLETQKTDIHLFASLESTRQLFSKIYQFYEKEIKEPDSIIVHTHAIAQSLRLYQLKHNFINTWLITDELDVIYTENTNHYTFKNLKTIPGINPKFLDACQKAKNGAYLTDILYISSETKKPYLILLCPLKGVKDSHKGIILMKINFQNINNILTQRTGMGNTGESYVVGENFIMRSVSRFLDEPDSHSIVVKTIGSEKALNGRNGSEIIKDYRGVDVLSSYSTINMDGVRWAILSEIDLEEALQPIYELRKKIFPIVFTVCIIILFITLYLAQDITEPIQSLNALIGKLAKGILPERDIVPNNQDEIGEMMQSLNQLVHGLKKTSMFAEEIGKGNLNASFDPLSGQDTLGLSLLEMRRQLVALSKLVAEQNRLKTMSLVEGQENERRRISRELHDGVGQMLTALKFKIQELEDSEITQQLKKLIDETTQEVRRVSVNLMPSVLYDFGLEAALKILIKNTNLDIEFEYNESKEIPSLDVDIRICIYRIVQESLNNCLKYAQTKKVLIQVRHMKNHIEFLVKDFGKGFDLKEFYKRSENNPTNGIKNMKERVKLVGGSFKIESQPGKGTQISVKIPLN